MADSDVQIWRSEEYVSEVLKGHELGCKREFRMEKEIFYRLVDLLRDKNLLQDTRGVAVEEQVAIFMYAISKNASNREVNRKPYTIANHQYSDPNFK